MDAGSRTKTDHNSSPWTFGSGELKSGIVFLMEDASE